MNLRLVWATVDPIMYSGFGTSDENSVLKKGTDHCVAGFVPYFCEETHHNTQHYSHIHLSYALLYTIVACKTSDF